MSGGGGSGGPGLRCWRFSGVTKNSGWETGEARAKARGDGYVQKEVCLAMSECGRRSLGPHVMCPALGWYGYGYGYGGWGWGWGW